MPRNAESVKLWKRDTGVPKGAPSNLLRKPVVTEDFLKLFAVSTEIDLKGANICPILV